MDYQMKHQPHSPLGIIALKSMRALGEKVDQEILTARNAGKLANRDTNRRKHSYLVHTNEIRFANGEGKVKVKETVRGKDVYILCDVMNYSCTYEMFGFTNHMGPDEHFQDIKRTLSALDGKARRTTVIMPRLYASRQDKRKGRESLDCAMAVQELERMGVKAIMTFDVHNPVIQNAIPLVSFENLYPTYDIVKTILAKESNFPIHKDKLLVISPDTGGMDRAVYYAGVLGVDVGLFYKRRDHTRIVQGKNPIIEHVYLGTPVEGKDVLIVDDMIESGESILDIVAALKERKASRIFIATTFSAFTEGTDKFEKSYRDGLLDRVYSTNLTYISPQVKESPWFQEVDMSHSLAVLIDTLNYDRSVAPLLNATAQLKELLDRHRQ